MAAIDEEGAETYPVLRQRLPSFGDSSSYPKLGWSCRELKAFPQLPDCIGYH